MTAKLKWKYWLFGFALSLLALRANVEAATDQYIDIKVSIAGTKSVLVVGATTYNFGALNVSVSSVSTSSITIQNNSPVFIETYTITGANAISLSQGTDWTLNTSTGPNQYALGAQFSSTRPTDSNAAWTDDELSTSASTCSALDHGNGTEAQSGSNVGVNQYRGLWFRMKTPSTVTDNSQHNTTVTVSVL